MKKFIKKHSPLLTSILILLLIIAIIQYISSPVCYDGVIRPRGTNTDILVCKGLVYIGNSILIGISTLLLFNNITKGKILKQ